MADYTVSDVNGCKMVSGNPPVEDLVALLQVWKDQGHTETSGQLAVAQQAQLVAGSPESLEQWSSQLELDND